MGLTFSGSEGPASLQGGSGADTLSGLGGNDVIIGGAGTDTAVYATTLTAASITAVVDGDPVTAGNQAGWQVSAGTDGTDLLTGVEKVNDGAGSATSCLSATTATPPSRRRSTRRRRATPSSSGPVRLPARPSARS